jgi:hypothetical protein
LRWPAPCSSARRFSIPNTLPSERPHEPKTYPFVRPQLRPSLRSLIAAGNASPFSFGADGIGIFRRRAMKAQGLIGRARSSPKPPVAVARRARLEVVMPIRQTSLMARSSSTPLSPCQIHRSLRGPCLVGRNIASGVRRRHVPNAVRARVAAGGTTRSPALVPAGTAVRPSVADWLRARADGHAAGSAKWYSV